MRSSPAEALWNALDGPSPFRLENAKILLRARLARPSDIALNNVNVQSLGVESSPGVIRPLAPGKLHLKPTSRAEYDSLTPFLVIEGTKDLCQPNRLFFSGRFDETLRRLAFEVLGTQLARAGDWDGGVQAKFRSDAKRYLRL